MHKRSNSQIAWLLLIVTALGCSMLRRNRSPTWALTLEVDAQGDEQAAAVNQTVTVIQRRLDLLGLSNFKVEPQGNSRVLVSLPEVPDRDRLKKVIIAEGRLELAHVVSPPSPSPVQTYNSEQEARDSLGAESSSNRKILIYTERDEPAAGQVKNNSENSRKWVVIELPPVVEGRDLRKAEAVPGPIGEDYRILFSLNPSGAQRFGAWTAANINQYLSVVLNDEVKSIAYIRSQIFDQGEITGRFTRQSAEDLANVLNSGALPAPVKIVSETFIKQN